MSDNPYSIHQELGPLIHELSCIACKEGRHKHSRGEELVRRGLAIHDPAHPKKLTLTESGVTLWESYLRLFPF